MIPDPLVITIHRPPAADHVISVARNPGESEEDHVHRACRMVLAYIKANPSPKATQIEAQSPYVLVSAAPGQSDESFVAAFDSALQAFVSP